MFEILQAYETARHEKNKLLRFFLVRHVKRKLKKDFFKKFNYNITRLNLDKDFIEEFYHFHNCTHEGVYLRMDWDKSPYITYASGMFNKIHVRYYNRYEIRFKIFENTIDVDIIDLKKGVSVLIHPDNIVFYNSLFATIIIMAIYNYCVAYIYGKYSNSFIKDDYYINQIINMYF